MQPPTFGGVAEMTDWSITGIGGRDESVPALAKTLIETPESRCVCQNRTGSDVISRTSGT